MIHPEKYASKKEVTPAESEAEVRLQEGERALAEAALDRLAAEAKKSPKQEGRLSKSARATAAVMALFAGSAFWENTARAEETHALEPSPEVAAEPEMSESAQGAAESLEWYQKIIDTISLTAYQEGRTPESFETESIRFPYWLDAYNQYSSAKKSAFYKDASLETFTDAGKIITDSLTSSENAASFFSSIAGAGSLADQEKLIILQTIGGYLSRTYNYEMARNNDAVQVSDDEMFSSLRDLYLYNTLQSSGICGNIHDFVSKSARAMGMEAWLQSGLAEASGPQGHIWSGLVVKDSSGQEQIVWMNYDALAPTGTLNYKDALGIAERMTGRVDPFQSEVSPGEEALFSVRSRAAEVLRKSAGIKGGESMLDELMELGGRQRPNKLSVEISDETKEIALSKDSMAVAFFKYEDSQNNPYQSLSGMNAVRASLKSVGENLGVSLDTTVIHMSVKDLENGTVNHRDIINRLSGHYIDEKKFTRAGYEQFVLNYGGTIEAAAMFGGSVSELFKTSAALEAGAGVRLTYLDPQKPGKLFVEADIIGDLGVDNFVNQEIMPKSLGNIIKIGGTVKAREAVINWSAGAGRMSYGSRYQLGGSGDFGPFKMAINGEIVDSAFPRFVPESQKISGEVILKKPFGEILFFGSRTEEEYLGAPKETESKIGIGLRIILW